MAVAWLSLGLALGAMPAAAASGEENRVPPVKSAGPGAAAQGSSNAGSLTTLQAAEIAQRHADRSDARLEIVDAIDGGHLFGVTSGFDAGGRPPRNSRLLFVHDDGTVRQWTGK